MPQFSSRVGERFGLPARRSRYEAGRQKIGCGDGHGRVVRRRVPQREETAAPSTTQPEAVTTTSTTAVTTTTTALVTTTTSASRRTTTTSTGSTGPATTATTSPPNSTPDNLGRFRTPEDAATHLYEAWRTGDRNKAALSGQPAAVNFLFSLPDYPGGFALTGCTFRDAGYDCRFEGAADAVVMRVQGGASAGWRVTAGSLRS